MIVRDGNIVHAVHCAAAAREEPAIDVPPYIDAEQLWSLLSWDDAIAAIGAALESGAGAGGAPRTAVPVDHGQLLLMPAENADAVGVKLVSVAPGNPAAGHPRIQAVYVLMDSETLTPQVILDGAALTAIRTPAVSAFAAGHLAGPAVSRMVVFGSGPQARAHIEALASIRPISDVTVVSRNGESAARLTERLTDQGFAARTGRPDAVDDLVDDAELVVCATSARDPLFDGARLTDQACVIAVGSHEPEARELDETVFALASRVVVEDRTTALREAGDVIQAMMAGALPADALIELAELPGLGPPTEPGPAVFKSVGMGWQDLAIAQAALKRHRSGDGREAGRRG